MRILVHFIVAGNINLPWNCFLWIKWY